jgi:hypothetical protein
MALCVRVETLHVKETLKVFRHEWQWLTNDKPIPLPTHILPDLLEQDFGTVWKLSLTFAHRSPC